MGVLSGYRFVEFAGLGPAPFCAMMLADMGAQVIRITRKSTGGKPLVDPPFDILNRGRISVALDLKASDDRAAIEELIAGADGTIEGFRPGVMERLGLGPDHCLSLNPRLVYGRITGWGQDGPLAMRAGHDINYLALSGALSTIGRRDAPPVPPLNLVADFGGGGMLLTVGMLGALLETRGSGKGQVVDAAMVDGCALQLALIHSLKNMGAWSNRREDNMLDGGAPFYDTYQCADGGYVAVGAIEPEFHAILLAQCGLANPLMQDQWNRQLWPRQKAEFARVFRQEARDVWVERFLPHDGCVSPVLSLDEAADHEHNRARGTYLRNGDTIQPAAAPRYSRSPSQAGPIAEGGTVERQAALAAWPLSAKTRERILGVPER